MDPRDRRGRRRLHDNLDRLRVDVEESAERLFYRLATAGNERLSAYWRAQPGQLLLFHAYGRALAGGSLPGIDEAGFRTYSQFDEDGLVLYVLAIVGMGSRRCVDIGCGRPMGSNTTNLLANWNWQGLGIDGDDRAIRAGDQWFRRNRNTMFRPPRRVAAVVSPDNVNDLLGREGFDVEIDLLSIDIDGLDYWVWDAIEVVPRVVLIEFNASLPADRAVTVPLRDPVTTPEDMRARFAGASLAALVALAQRRGYRFVGVSSGVNAIFVRDDVIPAGTLPQPSVAQALSRPGRLLRHDHPDPRVLGHAWVEV